MKFGNYNKFVEWTRQQGVELFPAGHGKYLGIGNQNELYDITLKDGVSVKAITGIKLPYLTAKMSGTTKERLRNFMTLRGI